MGSLDIVIEIRQMLTAFLLEVIVALMRDSFCKNVFSYRKRVQLHDFHVGRGVNGPPPTHTNDPSLNHACVRACHPRGGVTLEVDRSSPPLLQILGGHYYSWLCS